LVWRSGCRQPAIGDQYHLADLAGIAQHPVRLGSALDIREPHANVLTRDKGERDPAMGSSQLRARPCCFEKA